MDSDHADERNFRFNPGRFSLLRHVTAIVLSPGSVMDIDATFDAAKFGVSGRRGETNAFRKEIKQPRGDSRASSGLGSSRGRAVGSPCDGPSVGQTWIFTVWHVMIFTS